MKLRAVLLTAIAVSLAFRFFYSAAQANSPAFAIADVHPSPSRLHPGIDGRFTADRVVLRDATLDDLISFAYHVQPSDILGGPAWLGFDRFDINAKPPDGTKIANQENDPATQAMLRALLVDRFSLVARLDTRPLPAFVLSVGNANMMKPAADPIADSGCQYQMQSTGNASSGPPLVHFSCRKTSMSSFAEFLHGAGNPYFNRPVVDQTGLKGGWDFDLAWTYDKSTNGNGISLPDSLLKQLGLRVESKPMPTPVVVIQNVNQRPTPNVADIEKLLPPPPPREFDVAVIHEANPDEKHFNIFSSSHRFTVQYATLLTLIYKSFDTPPAEIRNQPKWLDDVHWDITGTVASNGPEIPGREAGIDDEDVKEMIRSLLANRFKLVTHIGTEPSTVFALTKESPKMKLSPDTEHAACVEGPGPDGKDLRVDNPMRDRLISCQHMTMAQFAVELHTLASGYVPAPVVDQTGLPDAYDFSISFSRANKLRAPSSAPSASGSLTSGDSNALDSTDSGLPPLSLFDAIEKQLGLKLVKKDSMPTPVLIIDHIEEKPTEN